MEFLVFLHFCELLLSHALVFNAAESTFALGKSNSDEGPEVAFRSKMAAERREHTLTALWDHEAERTGAVGQGPGWLQAIRTAQPRR